MGYLQNVAGPVCFMMLLMDPFCLKSKEIVPMGLNVQNIWAGNIVWREVRMGMDCGNHVRDKGGT